MSTPKSFSIETATWRGHCLALAEGLHNVNIALTLPQLQPIVSCAAPCRSVETSDLQELFVRHPSSNSTPQGHSICLQMVPAEIAPANTRPACHQLDKLASALIGAPLGKLPCSDNFSFFEPMCSSLSSGRTCSTMEVTCDGDPPCATGADTVCDVETAGETGTLVC